MKIKLIGILIAIICNQLFVQGQSLSAPGISWMKATMWPSGNFTGTTNGEDWFYGHKIRMNGSSPAGYVAVGYSTFISGSNFSSYVPDDLCPNDPFVNNNCGDMRNGQYESASWPSVAFPRLDGSYSGKYFTIKDHMGDFNDVIQIGNSFYAAGNNYSIQDLANSVSGTPVLFQYNQNQTPSGNHFFDIGVVGCSNYRGKASVTKLDSSGNIAWTKIYGKDNFSSSSPTMQTIALAESRVSNIVATEDGGMVISIITLQRPNPTTGPLVYQFHVMKIEDDGDWVWTKHITDFALDSNKSDEPYGLALTRASESGTEFFYVSSITNNGSSTGQPFLCKLTSSGGFEWSGSGLVLFGSNAAPNRVTKIAVDKAGNIIVPVITNASFVWGGGYGTGVVYKLDPGGSVLGYTAGTDIGDLKAYDMKFGVTATSDGGFAAVSTKRLFPLGGPLFHDACSTGTIASGDYRLYNSDAYVVKYNRNLEKEWDKTFDSNTQNPLNSNTDVLNISACSDSNNSACPTSNAAWLFPNPSGYDVRKQECMYTIVQAPDGGLVVAGNTSNNLDDSYLVKLGSICDVSNTVSNVTVTSSREYVSSGILYVDNITLQNSSDLALRSSKKVRLTAGKFTSSGGGSYKIQIDPDLACIPDYSNFIFQQRNGETEEFQDMSQSNGRGYEDPILLAPNPTTGEFWGRISLKDSEVGKMKVEISNQLGNTIYGKEMDCSGQNCNFSFDLTGNAKGIYFISVNVNNKRTIKKIVLL